MQELFNDLEIESSKAGTGAPLRFECFPSNGYDNLVQFLSDVFCLYKQMRRLTREALVKKLTLLQKMLVHTPEEKRQYPMNCFLEVPLSITERALLVMLIRKQLVSPGRPVEMEDAISLLGDQGQPAIEELFTFFVLKKGALRERPFIGEKLSGCVLKKPIITEKSKPDAEQKPELMNISPKDIQKKLDKFVIGQREAKEKLSVAFFEHLLKCMLSTGERTFYKNNVFLIGPTGTGKTYLCRTLAKLMKVPFLHVDMSHYTASGYVGNSVKDIIINLADMVHVSSGKLPVSIVFLDEIDKVTAKNCTNGRDVRGSSVQEELLRMLETDEIQEEKTNTFRPEQRVYNISDVFFVAAGACSGLDKIVAQRLKKKHAVGFTASDDVTATGADEVQTEDLLKYGFLPEFLSRFGYVAKLTALTQEQLEDVLLRTDNNVLAQYKELFAACKKPLRFSRAQAKKLARQVCGHKLGVRALNQLLSEEMARQLNGLSYRVTVPKEVKNE